MRWYDSISEKWVVTREPEAVAEAAPDPEDDHARAARLVRESRLWEAVVASATASRIHTEKSGS